MTQHIFFPERFKNPSRYYTTGRPVYPKQLSKRVAERVKLSRTDHVLDLGTGPGFLAIDFAPLAGKVTAVDPEDAMLDVARQNVARERVTVEVVKGSSFELPALGKLKLVTIGRAFHWMDGDQTLATLDKLLESHGAVALFGDRFPEIAENAWRKDFQDLIDSYSTEDPAKVRTRGAEPHESVFLRSAFSHVERIAVLERRRTPVERFVDRALSFGAAWDGRPGSREDDLAGEVRKLIARFADSDGTVTEVIEGQALLGFRPVAVDSVAS
ncbi:MAG: class I SAM-dependent methyltransferase [Polyangiales bacterium]